MKRFLSYGMMLLLFAGILHAENPAREHRIDWNGYIQLRGTTNFDDHYGFSLRRLKLWVHSGPGFSDHWSFKVQTTFSSFAREKFFLQDVKAGYRNGIFSLDMGQFVPQYSLQRFQHDYLLPSIERAKVINTLIPDGTLGVRDLGVQANISTKNRLLRTSVGIFNGYGILEYRFNNAGFMITHKTTVRLPVGKNTLQAGYSFQYRKAENLRIPFVLPDTLFFSGNDIRFNIFARYSSKHLEIQGEYLNAGFDGQHAYGYYILSAITLKKEQIVLSWEYYHDLIDETSDRPCYRIGYNHLFREHKLKLSADNYFRIRDHRTEYIASLQFQIFFN